MPGTYVLLQQPSWVPGVLPHRPAAQCCQRISADENCSVGMLERLATPALMSASQAGIPSLQQIGHHLHTSSAKDLLQVSACLDCPVDQR